MMIKIGKTKLGLDIILHPDNCKAVLVEQANKITIADEPDFFRGRNSPRPINGKYFYRLQDWQEFEFKFDQSKKTMHDIGIFR